MRWKDLARDFEMGLNIGIHKGDLNILYPFIYGSDVDVINFLSSDRAIRANNECYIVASQTIRDDAQETNWERKFHQVDPNQFTNDFGRRVIEDYGVYQFVVDG